MFSMACAVKCVVNQSTVIDRVEPQSTKLFMFPTYNNTHNIYRILIDPLQPSLND